MKPPKLTSKSDIQTAWWRRAGILYFFAAGSPPVAVKLGVTSIAEGKSPADAVRQRFRAIQSSNHETVELLGIIHFTSGEFPMRDAEVMERELHTRFSDLQRFKQHTVAAERFNASPDLLAFVRDSATDPDTIGISRLIALATNRNTQNSN